MAIMVIELSTKNHEEFKKMVLKTLEKRRFRRKLMVVMLELLPKLLNQQQHLGFPMLKLLVEQILILKVECLLARLLKKVWN